MNLFSKALAALAAATLSAAPIAAQPVDQHSPVALDYEHAHLIATIQSVGIPVTYDHEICASNSNVAGFYNGLNGWFTICKGSTPWTPYHLDTLRHEAQHLVQDCAADGRIDFELAPYLENPVTFAQSVGFTDEDFLTLRRLYSRLSDQDFLLEVEAFAVAAAVSPSDIASAIVSTCPTGA